MGVFFQIIAVVLLLAAPALAAEQNPDAFRDVDFMAKTYYDMLAKQALDRPERYEFGTLRLYYTQTPQYDPIGEQTRKRLLALSYKAKNETDPEKRAKALVDYQKTVDEHLGNLDVVSLALVMSTQDKIFGDPSFYEWLRTGLVQDLMNSGDGTSLVKAYDAITLGEEAVLLSTLGVKVLKSEIQESGGTYYNMHQVEDGKSSKPYWIFVDTTPAFAFLARQEKLKTHIFSIPAQ